MFEWLSILSAYLKWSLYGLLGALVGIAHDAYKGKKDTCARKGLRIFVSTALAHMVGNSGLVEAHYLSAAGFATGLLGMSLVEGLEKFLQRMVDEKFGEKK